MPWLPDGTYYELRTEARAAVHTYSPPEDRWRAETVKKPIGLYRAPAPPATTPPVIELANCWLNAVDVNQSQDVDVDAWGYYRGRRHMTVTLHTSSGTFEIPNSSLMEHGQLRDAMKLGSRARLLLVFDGAD